MMKNKVLIKVTFPTIDKSYDIKIPVNELVWKVNKLIVKAIYDIDGISVDMINDNCSMINKTTGEIYPSNVSIIDTNIRNGTEIVFLKSV